MSALANANTVVDWRWLNGTTWYIPTSGLPAYTYTPLNNTITPVQDQTVYTITGYRNGYFWGRTAGQIDTNDISCMSLVGSVTPEGKIYLTFTPFPCSPGDEPTVGVGTMVRKAGKWMMQNQVSTGSPSLQIGHWAYMVQTKPNTASWYSLTPSPKPASSWKAGGASTIRFEHMDRWATDPQPRRSSFRSPRGRPSQSCTNIQTGPLVEG